MDNCFKDYVGLRLCSDPDNLPSSGLFIDTLPGLSIEVLDNIATEDQVTYKQLYSDAQDEAWPRFVLDFYNELIECYDLTNNCDWEDLICDNQKILVNAWKYLLGNQLMIYRLYTDRLNFFTLDDAKATSLMNLYATQYQQALNKAVNVMDTSSVRLECGTGQLKAVTWLP